MALALEKTTEEGFIVSYWRVNPTMSYDAENKTLHASIMVYANQAARVANKRPTHYNDEDFHMIQHIQLSGVDATTAIASDDPRGAIYKHLKTLDFFAKATDVLET